MPDHLLTGAQIRAARALLRWSAAELARKASLGLNTIKRAEANDGTTALTVSNERVIRGALELAGVEFTNGDQPGVRLAKAAPANSDAGTGLASERTVTAKPARRGRADKKTKHG